VFVDELGRIRFDVSDQIRQRDIRFQSNQHMNVVSHTVDRDQFLALMANDSGDILVNLFFVFRANQALSALNGENDLDVNLRVGIGHNNGSS
jgi:hypothetical protein